MEGKLSITRSSNDIISIKVEDVLSSITFLDIEITPEEFAKAVTNLSCRPCDFEVKGLNLIGKKLEVKTELVDYKGYENFSMIMKEIVKPYEVDGWKADNYYIENHNSYNVSNDRKKYKITFKRYINLNEKENDK